MVEDFVEFMPHAMPELREHPADSFSFLNTNSAFSSRPTCMAVIPNEHADASDDAVQVLIAAENNIFTVTSTTLRVPSQPPPLPFPTHESGKRHFQRTILQDGRLSQREDPCYIHCRGKRLGQLHRLRQKFERFRHQEQGTRFTTAANECPKFHNRLGRCHRISLFGSGQTLWCSTGTRSCSWCVAH